ncbi:hypothetical protein GCM10010123_44210 [Pilimelia anulata]|uniref:Uncharacterized protein n=2 Tax=Pilimelia anulata TaxID=53371 RepID=A0A8J3BK37_9ACTN|nr:hypothetical protein GCM10010123_44210 [Pilimelia anulata]
MKFTGRRRLALVAVPDPVPVEGPSLEELAAIEAEEPLILAELDVVDAECRIARRDVVTEWDWRRLRRAQDKVTRVAAQLRRLGACSCPPYRWTDTEVRMSDCRYGCKVWRCRCGAERLLHSAIYGCPTGRAALTAAAAAVA